MTRTVLAVVFMMMVSTVWAYKPAPDTQTPDALPYVAAVTAPAVPADVRPRLQEGDHTADGRYVGTRPAESNQKTVERNQQWVGGQIRHEHAGTITLTPQTPQTRVQYRTRYRTQTRTRTVHVGLTEKQARGIISVDNDRVRDQINAHTDEAIGGLAGAMRENHKVVTGNQQTILDAVSTAIQNQFGQYWWLYGIAAGVIACIVMLAILLHRTGSNSTQATATQQPQTPAPTVPTAPAAVSTQPETLPTATTSPARRTVLTAPTPPPATKPASVPAAPAPASTTMVDQVARDKADAAMKVAKAAGRVGVDAHKKASVACRGVKAIIPEIFAEEDSEGAAILAEMAELGIS